MIHPTHNPSSSSPKTRDDATKITISFCARKAIHEPIHPPPLESRARAKGLSVDLYPVFSNGVIIILSSHTRSCAHSVGQRLDINENGVEVVRLPHRDQIPVKTRRKGLRSSLNDTRGRGWADVSGFASTRLVQSISRSLRFLLRLLSDEKW